MRILVLDDDVRLLEEVQNILVRNGHTADCAASAKQALDLIQESQYDFIFVDYRMPERDGFWFLKNANLPKQTKTLLVTLCIDRKTLRDMFAAGISGYLMKPFDEDDILRQIEFYAARNPDPPVEGTRSP